MEVYVLVPVRRTFAIIFLSILFMVLAVGCLVLSCTSMLFFVVAIVFGLLGFFFYINSNKEFEYSYFDGEVRFARIMNKSRRKVIGTYSMEEVVQIAPAGDRSVYKYENDSSVKVKDYTSHLQEVKYFEMIVNKNGEMSLIKFEPNENYLDEVMKKYPQKVIR